MIDVDFNADNLWGMLQAMRPAERVRLMKAAMRRSARDVKDRAFELLVSRLRHVSNRTALKKTIWTKVYDRTAGFRVTVAGNAHTYPSRMRNSSGEVRELPLARWLEDGAGLTAGRTTAKGYARGKLPALRFMKQAKEEMGPVISGRLEDNFEELMIRLARKYGCI